MNFTRLRSNAWMAPTRWTASRSWALAGSVSMFLALAPAPAWAQASVRGDLSGDGRVQANDVLLAFQLALGGVPAPGQMEQADVAPLVDGEVIGDDVVDAADALLYVRALESDLDGDGLPADVEAVLGLSPFSRNTDGTGPDDGDEDSDGDGISNLDEIARGTDPGDAADPGQPEIELLGPDLPATIDAPSVLNPAVVYTAGDITIAPGASLRIPDGTEIRFDPFSSIFVTVDGRLVIQGSSAGVRLLSATETPWGGLILASTDNVIDGALIENVFNGLFVSEGARVTVANSTMRKVSTRGIVVQGPDASLTVQDSMIAGSEGSGSGIEIRGPTSDALIERVDISGFERCVRAFDASPRVAGSDVHGCSTAIDLFGIVSPVIVDSTIRDSDIGLRFDPDLLAETDQSSPRVSGNDFIDNELNILVEGTPGDALVLDVRANWWGTPDPLGVVRDIADRNLPGSRLARAIYCPFLLGPKDTAPALGPAPDVLCGLIEEDATLDPSVAYRLVGGLVIGENATLTIPAETSIGVEDLPERADTPGPRLGAIDVLGTLRVEGALGSEATLRSLQASPPGNAWRGIELFENGVANIRGLTLEHAQAALYVVGPANLSVEESRLVNTGQPNAGQPAIYLGGGGSIDATIFNNLIEPVPGSGGSFSVDGIESDGTSGQILVDGNTIRGSSTGIHVFSSTAQIAILGNAIRENRTGVDIFSSSPLIQGNTIEANDSGISIRGGSSPVINGRNRIISNGGRGISVERSFSSIPPTPAVNENEISGNGFENFQGLSNYSVSQTDGEPIVLDATRNFWGVTNKLQIESTVTEQFVEFCPFLDALGGAPLPCTDELPVVPRELADAVLSTDAELIPGEPYVIAGTLTIAREATVTIAPDTVLAFEPGASLIVEGTLLAQGGAQGITFRSNASRPAAGDWSGVVIRGTSDGTILDSVTIQHAQIGVDLDGGGDPAQTYRISNCQISDFTLAGIRNGFFILNGPSSFNRSTGLIEGNLISNPPAPPGARSAIGIQFAGPSPSSLPAPTLTVSGNTVRELSQGMLVGASSPLIQGNTLESNDVGIQIRFQASPIVTGGNRIVFNETGILRVGGALTRPRINGNAIYGSSGFDYQSSGAPNADPFDATFIQDAQGNYWGTTDPVAIASKVRRGDDAALPGHPVDFVPFLDAEGGQPVPEDGLLAGVLDVPPGTTVTVAAGTQALLLADTLVPAGVTLEIQQGAEVRALAGQGLGIDGTLRVLGTASAPVLFSPLDPATAWRGLDIRPGSTGSTIVHARLERTARSAVRVQRPGIIDVRSAELTITDSELFDFADNGAIVVPFPGSGGIAYRDGATGLVENVTIDNVARRSGTTRVGNGLLIERASPTVLGTTIRETEVGIYILGASTAQIGAGNVVTQNDVGILLEGTFAPGDNPSPVIHGSAIFANARSGGPVENLKLGAFDVGSGDVIDATGNFFGSTDPAAIRATIVTSEPFPVNFSGFLDALAGSPVPGSSVAFSLPVFIDGATGSPFNPLVGETVAFDFRMVAAGSVRVVVYDRVDKLRQQAIRSFDLGALPVGPVRVEWNGKDASGNVVTDAAYKFVIETQQGGETFIQDSELEDRTGAVIGVIPQTFGAFRNEFLKLPIDLAEGPAYINVVVQPSSSQPMVLNTKQDADACVAAGTCFFAIEDHVAQSGPSVLTFDGRDPAGNVLSGPLRVDFVKPILISDRVAIVQGTLPGLQGPPGGTAPDVDVLPYPYAIFPVLDQQSAIVYCLDRPSVVTLKLLRPGFGHSSDPAAVAEVLVDRQLQPASNCDSGGSPQVAYVTGLDPADPTRLQLSEDGAYTFVLDAEDPANPALRTRARGVLHVFESSTR